MRDRIVLVGVALGTAHSQAHPHLASRSDPVFDGLIAELLVVSAALGVVHRVAVEAGCDEVVVGRLRQQVASQLLDGELIEGHVLVERADDPVAVWPDRA